MVETTEEPKEVSPQTVYKKLEKGLPVSQNDLEKVLPQMNHTTPGEHQFNKRFVLLFLNEADTITFTENKSLAEQFRILRDSTIKTLENEKNIVLSIKKSDYLVGDDDQEALNKYQNTVADRSRSAEERIQYVRNGFGRILEKLEPKIAA